MALWDDIKRELANLWEILTTGEVQTPPEDIPEEPEDEGGFFGGDDEEPPSTGGGFFGDEDEEPEPEYDRGTNFGYEAGDGPYPDDWGEAEIRFWDRQMHDHIFDNEDNYDEAQRLFYDGYMARDDEITHEDRVTAREEFLDETYLSDIDWNAFADYYAET